MVIKNEYDYLIHLIGSTINGTSAQEKPERLLFESILQCAKRHYVSGMSYNAVLKLNNLPSDKIMTEWKAIYYKAIRRDVLQDEILDKISLIFTENEIPMMCIQGTKVKKYYPSPEFREMADLDVMIREEDATKATELLIENGFELQKNDDGEVLFITSKLNIELHTDFFGDKNVFYNSVKAKDIIANPFQYKTEKNENRLYYDIDDNAFYVYFYLHLLKHFQGKGVGIRRIVDIYYIEKEFADKIDRKFTDEKIQKSGLYEEYKKLIELKDYWFNGKEPSFNVEDLAKEVYLAELHGTQHVVISRDYNKIQKKGKHFIKLRYLFSRLYMNKQQIYKSYPFCERHHYPLFLSLIHRFFCIIFSRKHRQNMKKELKVVDKKKNQSKI